MVLAQGLHIFKEQAYGSTARKTLSFIVRQNLKARHPAGEVIVFWSSDHLFKTNSNSSKEPVSRQGSYELFAWLLQERTESFTPQASFARLYQQNDASCAETFLKDFLNLQFAFEKVSIWGGRWFSGCSQQILKDTDSHYFFFLISDFLFPSRKWSHNSILWTMLQWTHRTAAITVLSHLLCDLSCKTLNLICNLGIMFMTCLPFKKKY